MPWLSMIAVSALLGVRSVEQSPHRSNLVYRALIEQGLTIQGKKTSFDEPRLRDGLSKEEQQKALVEIAGSERAVRDFVRPSVTAPHVLRLHDEKTETGDVIRGGKLWFVVYADLDEIDPAAFARKAAESRPVEAGNMRFTSKLLEPGELQKRMIPVATNDSEAQEWYVHLSGRLLDRIEVEDTDRLTASRSEESWIVAARTDPRFDKDQEYGNRWSPIGQSAAAKAEPRVYPGGASYVKISRLATTPGALLVEAHFAFMEPGPWFDGAPILRSKISLVAQDRIRGLRSELAKSRKGSELRKTTGTRPERGGSLPVAK